MMKTIASKLQRKRVALVVALGVSVMIFATVVEEITGVRILHAPVFYESHYIIWFIT